MLALQKLKHVSTVYMKVYKGLCHRHSSQVHDFLRFMDRTIKSEPKVPMTDYLRQLEQIDIQWPQAQQGQKLLSSVLHTLLVNERPGDLLTLIEYLKSADYVMWSGMSNLVLQSYIKLKMWDEAVQQHELMKKDQKIKHVRTIREFISELAVDNQLPLVLKYFQELWELEININTSPFKEPDVEMLTKILHSIERNVCTKRTPCSEYKFTKTPPGYDFSFEIVETVLKYMEFWNITPSNTNLNLIFKFLSDTTKFSVSNSILEGSVCQTCKTDLNISFNSVCQQVINSIEKQCANMHADLRFLNDALEKNHAFNVIVDAGNIMFGGSKDQKHLNIDLLKNVLCNLYAYCKEPFFNVAVIFPQSFSRPEKLRPFSFLNKIAADNILNFTMTVIPLKRINDDLVLCYLAAKSELRLMQNSTKPVIVTGDNFYNHRHVVDDNKQGEFLDWIRYRKKSFRDPVLQDKPNLRHVKLCERHIHLLGENNRLLCIQK